MSQKIDRREFLVSMIAPWITKRNLMRGTLIVALTLIMTFVASVIRSVGVWATLELCGVFLVAACVLCGIEHFSKWMESLPNRMPLPIRVVVSVVMSTIAYAMVGLVRKYLV